MVNGQWSIVNSEWFKVDAELGIVNYPIINYQLFNYQLFSLTSYNLATYLPIMSNSIFTMLPAVTW